MVKEKFYSTFIFFKLLAAISAILLLVTWIIDTKCSSQLFLVTFVLVIFVISLVVLRLLQLNFRSLNTQMHDVNQLESLLWLYQHIKPSIAFNPMGVYAGTPDFFKFVISNILQSKPSTIVELGSGVSSMVISEYLKDNAPDTKHIAMDHLENYADTTAKKIKNPHSIVLWAPLVEYNLKDKLYQWYDLSKISDIDNIDLLVVDGPPADLNPLARYPSLPMLWEKLSVGAIIILDDAARKDEQDIISIWKKEFNVEVEYLYTQKGTAIFKKLG